MPSEAGTGRTLCALSSLCAPIRAAQQDIEQVLRDASLVRLVALCFIAVLSVRPGTNWRVVGIGFFPIFQDIYALSCMLRFESEHVFFVSVLFHAQFSSG